MPCCEAHSNAWAIADPLLRSNFFPLLVLHPELSKEANMPESWLFSKAWTAKPDFTKWLRKDPGGNKRKVFCTACKKSIDISSHILICHNALGFFLYGRIWVFVVKCHCDITSVWWAQAVSLSLSAALHELETVTISETLTFPSCNQHNCLCVFILISVMMVLKVKGL